MLRCLKFVLDESLKDHYLGSAIGEFSFLPAGYRYGLPVLATNRLAMSPSRYIDQHDPLISRSSITGGASA